MPVTEVVSTSPSPEKVPPVMTTVAPTSFRLSGSVTDTEPESVVFVRLSAGDSDGLVTPEFAWSYQPSESS